ncbi:hypothetical protein HDU88_004021 [Geranomyces variabilis]|nr:hypothetical protein HDU88_004021 [Geranomyces variabilis]
MPTGPTLTGLPLEVQKRIFDFVPIGTVADLSQASSVWRQLASDPKAYSHRNPEKLFRKNSPAAFPKRCTAGTAKDRYRLTQKDLALLNTECVPNPRADRGSMYQSSHMNLFQEGVLLRAAYVEHGGPSGLAVALGNAPTKKPKPKWKSIRQEERDDLRQRGDTPFVPGK